MSIDPRIPLGVQPLQLPSPLEIYQTVQQIQGQREATEARRLAAEEARQRRVEQQEARAQQAAIDRALQAAIKIDDKTGRITFDRQTLLAGVPATVAYKLQKELDDDEVSANTLAKSLLDLEGTKREYRGSIGRTIRAGQYAPGVFRPLMRGAHGFGALDDDLATQYEALEDPAAIQAVVDDWVAQGGGKPPNLEKITTLDAQGREVTRFVEPTAGAEFPTAPAAADLITVQTIDAQGRPVTRIVPKVGGAEYPNQPPAPSTRDERIVSVLDANGKPVYVRESQAVGRTPGSAASGAEGGVKLTPAQQEDVATMLTVQDLGKEALALGDKIKWRGVGPVAGRTGAAAARWLGAGGEDPERLRNLIGNIQGTIAKLRGGASFTPSEQLMLDRYTPTTTDSVLQIQTKLKSLSDFITTKRENTLRVAGGQYTPRETAPAGTTAAPAGGGAATMTYQDYLNAQPKRP